MVFDNESLLGKTVLIDVWATWCDSPAEFPGLLRPTANITTGTKVLVSFDDDRQLARDFRRQIRCRGQELRRGLSLGREGSGD